MRHPSRECRLTFCTIFLSIVSFDAWSAAPQITSFTPTTGSIGTSVTVNGSGFTGATDVSFKGSPAAFRVVSDTRITETAPNTVTTGPISVTTSSGTGTSTANFSVLPGAGLSPAAVHPLGQLQVYGAGFTRYSAIDVYLDTTDIALSVSNASGSVSVQVQVPASAQPGAHWITLVQRGGSTAAQQSFVVNTNWTMDGFNAQNQAANPYENTITTGNVNSLGETWTQAASRYANPEPMAVYNGSVFVGTVDGVVNAYSPTGALLWTGSPGSSLQSVSPAVYAGKVFFGAANGNVYAYSTTCHTNGAACTASWIRNVGSSVTGDLSIFQGQLYAPSSDGTVHVLNPTTGAPGTPIYGFDTSHGAVTTPATFGPNGSFYYGAGSYLHYSLSSGSSGYQSFSGTVSPLAYANGAAYFTTGDGNVHEFGGAGWSATTSGTGCTPAPVVANGLVFAGGCSSLAAFEAGQGTLRWSITTGRVIGLAAANGVLYACQSLNGGFGGSLIAYAASYGGLLWTGGGCNGTPIIVNGTLFGAFADVSAYNLPGVAPDRSMAQPDPRMLRPDYRLSRKPYAAPASAIPE